MDILFIEPFYSGSHKSWLDQLQKYSKHNFQLLTMEGKAWKWRMYGSSVTLSKQLESVEKADIILVSDMLDLATFISLSRHELNRLSNPKIGVYFHENQLAYPWQEDGDDTKLKRDVHYGMMNYNSALSADFVLFNSQYNRETFLTELDHILAKMPDYHHLDSIDEINKKSTILPIGLEAPTSLSKEYIEAVRKKYALSTSYLPLILWNHRLDHDKNPELFLRTLIQLKNEGYAFHLAFLGEMNHRNLNKYGYLLEELKDETVAIGFLEKNDYVAFLHLADILPVTSNHDFFGISVMEAISYGCIPILPTRLTYPKLYNISKNPELFYATESEFKPKLVDAMNNLVSNRSRHYIHLSAPYLWENVIIQYDQYFDQIFLS